MFGILGLGFLLGMQHALEADHIAAVSSIAARRRNVADIVKHGLTWGIGHTLTLFVFAGAAILLGHAIPDSVARPIETAVGLMLIGLERMLHAQKKPETQNSEHALPAFSCRVTSHTVGDGTSHRLGVCTTPKSERRLTPWQLTSL